MFISFPLLWTSYLFPRKSKQKSPRIHICCWMSVLCSRAPALLKRWSLIIHTLLRITVSSLLFVFLLKAHFFNETFVSISSKRSSISSLWKLGRSSSSIRDLWFSNTGNHLYPPLPESFQNVLYVGVTFQNLSLARYNNKRKRRTRTVVSVVYSNLLYFSHSKLT